MWKDICNKCRHSFTPRPVHMEPYLSGELYHYFISPRPNGTISQWRTLPLFPPIPFTRNHISVENSIIILSHPVHTEPYLSGELYHYSISPCPYGTISQWRTLPLFPPIPSIRNWISLENSTIILSYPVNTEPYFSGKGSFLSRLPQRKKGRKKYKYLNKILVDFLSGQKMYTAILVYTFMVYCLAIPLQDFSVHLYT